MKQFPVVMTGARRVVATIVLLTLGAASAAAQSPAPAPAADPAAGSGSRQCPTADAAAPSERGPRLPDSIRVAEDLRPRLHAMLLKSATFRSQCRRLGESPQLDVRVKINLAMTGRTYRAVTRICRQPSGRIVAAIDLAPYGDPAEWLAHEFEHLIEQIEGVNLPDLERRRQGAWKSGNQMFETERAVRIGRLVSREMREPAMAAPVGEAAALAPTHLR
ncbi:MAG: hypothetical protein ABI868_03910 [Acidobacteriota bacterium]